VVGIYVGSQAVNIGGLRNNDITAAYVGNIKVWPTSTGSYMFGNSNRSALNSAGQDLFGSSSEFAMEWFFLYPSGTSSETQWFLSSDDSGGGPGSADFGIAMIASTSNFVMNIGGTSRAYSGMFLGFNAGDVVRVRVTRAVSTGTVFVTATGPTSENGPTSDSISNKSAFCKKMYSVDPSELGPDSGMWGWSCVSDGTTKSIYNTADPGGTSTQSRWAIDGVATGARFDWTPDVDWREIPPYLGAP
jgi:hypothetical protein